MEFVQLLCNARIDFLNIDCGLRVMSRSFLRPRRRTLNVGLLIRDFACLFMAEKIK